MQLFRLGSAVILFCVGLERHGPASMYLWWSVSVLQQHSTQRLLLALVHVRKAENLLGVRRGQRQEGFVSWDKDFLVTSDKQDTVSAR